MSHVGHGRQATSPAATTSPGGTGPLYSPADLRGNFAPLLAEDSSAAEIAGTFDLEELEHDLSERKPGGPVAELILAFPPRVLLWKWLIPFIGFLLASLFQSAGVFHATCAYAGWMSALEKQVKSLNPMLGEFVLRDAYTGSEPLPHPGRDLRSSPSESRWTLPTISDASTGALYSSQREIVVVGRRKPEGSSSADSAFSSFGSSSAPLDSAFGSSSSFGSSFGGSSSPSSSSGSLDFSWLLPAPQNVITGALAISWVSVIIKTKNLRLWSQVMLVGVILSLLKGLFLFSTVLPDPSGWLDCREGLDSNVLSTATSEGAPGILSLVTGFADIFTIWMMAPRSLVCSDGILSRPTYVASLYALGLYDAGRTTTRKLKPHFRWLYRLLFGTALALLVLWNGRADVQSHHQYTLDVALALVFTLLLYGSPVVALAVDKWLKYDPEKGKEDLSLLVGGDKDSYDEGDVIVPICCFPCCCLHDRFFLYSAPAREAEAELKTREEQERKTTADFRKMAASKAEEFRLTQEDAARRLLELEALIHAEQQRSEAREHDEERDAKRLLEEAVADVKEQIASRTATALEELQKKEREQKEAAARLQEQASGLAESKLAEELELLQSEIDVGTKSLQEKQEELTFLEKNLARSRESAKELGILLS